MVVIYTVFSPRKIFVLLHDSVINYLIFGKTFQSGHGDFFGLKPGGYLVDILYRHWMLSQVVTSPLPRTVALVDTPPQLYHGPHDRDYRFSLIFEPLPQRVSRVTLVLSSGCPHRTGHRPPLSSLEPLSDVVEVLRVIPYLPPGHVSCFVY